MSIAVCLRRRTRKASLPARMQFAMQIATLGRSPRVVGPVNSRGESGECRSINGAPAVPAVHQYRAPLSRVCALQLAPARARVSRHRRYRYNGESALSSLGSAQVCRRGRAGQLRAASGCECELEAAPWRRDSPPQSRCVCAAATGRSLGAASACNGPQTSSECCLSRLQPCGLPASDWRPKSRSKAARSGH